MDLRGHDQCFAACNASACHQKQVDLEGLAREPRLSPTDQVKYNAELNFINRLYRENVQNCYKRLTDGIHAQPLEFGTQDARAQPEIAITQARGKVAEALQNKTAENLDAAARVIGKTAELVKETGKLVKDLGDDKFKPDPFSGVSDSERGNLNPGYGQQGSGLENGRQPAVEGESAGRTYLSPLGQQQPQGPMDIFLELLFELKEKLDSALDSDIQRVEEIISIHTEMISP